MIRKLLPGFIALLLVNSSFAQMPGGGMGGGFKSARAKVGHFYGKVVDSVTGKAIAFAAIQISGPQWDSVSHSLKTAALQGLLTGDNGEFSFEKLPVMGQFTIQINAMGYHNFSETVSFDLSKAMKNAKSIQSQANSDTPDLNAMASAINAVDKDLGNIKVAPDATQIKAVTVNGEAPAMELKLDKRVFDVSKSLTTTGGTAEDVLKTIPAVNVDIDGNVSLRNASPTIYVDGLPTTLTIDQIPADEIDKIEVITNPSAKFDASAGTGGIINIIMKHNQALGYNGSVRAGIDEYGKYNAGFDFNLRQGKVNWFLNLHYHQVKHIMYGSETRDTVHGQPAPYLQNTQRDTNTMNGYFGFVRTGFDFFIDNRNTVTVSGTYGTGNFNVSDLLHTNTDTVRDATSLPNASSYTYENSTSNRVFTNLGASLLYKHLFPKEDETITASITANEGKSTGEGTFDTYNYDVANGDDLSNIEEQQTSGGTNYYYVGKMDFTDPITKKIELDMGLMSTINDVNSNSTLMMDGETNQAESVDYTFNQQVYAAYFTFSQTLTSRLSYQLALRVEQSLYSGQETDTATTNLNTQSLLKPFPGAFITYHLTDKSDLQLSYTTHITRPSFSQLVVNNYSNILSYQLANANLEPAYQNSFELNYMHTFDRRSSLLLSAYYKLTNDLITTKFLSPNTIYIKQTNGDSVATDQYNTTTSNANYGYSEGAEATAQFSPTQWLDVTANYNLYESGINATNLGVPDTTKPYLSYFAKLNLTFKLPKNFTIQLNGSYQSKTQIPIGGSGGGRWGGGPGGGGITPSASGYIIPTYTLDAAIKKEFLKNNKASITFNVRDVFATAVNGTYTTATAQEETAQGEEPVPLYYQTTSRHNQAPYFTLNFSYRFGQQDISIFKRKNNNIDMGPDMGGDSGGGN
jgi:hypothetical protein